MKGCSSRKWTPRNVHTDSRGTTLSGSPPCLSRKTSARSVQAREISKRAPEAEMSVKERGGGVNTESAGCCVRGPELRTKNQQLRTGRFGMLGAPYCCAASIRYSAASAASAEKFAFRGRLRTSLHWPFAYIT